MRRKPFFLIVLLLAASSLSACGYRGALTLPDESQNNKQTPAESPADQSGDTQ
ncbi:LPS translocon maturation chaperone LptM [Alteromonas confluentis]|uniref:LPS translocon maturation chaperone LptM n=1 Tax=Alteromonas confluentis TaxID=1656094 RepID=UPI003CCBA323